MDASDWSIHMSMYSHNGLAFYRRFRARDNRLT